MLWIKNKARAALIWLTAKFNEWAQRIETKNKAMRETRLDPRVAMVEAHQKLELAHARKRAEASMRGWFWGFIYSAGWLAILFWALSHTLAFIGVIDRSSKTELAPVAQECQIFDVPPISTGEELY